MTPPRSGFSVRHLLLSANNTNFSTPFIGRDSKRHILKVEDPSADSVATQKGSALSPGLEIVGRERFVVGAGRTDPLELIPPSGTSVRAGAFAMNTSLLMYEGRGWGERGYYFHNV